VKEAQQESQRLPNATNLVKEKDVESGQKMAIEFAVGEHNDVHPDLKMAELNEDSDHLKGLYWACQCVSILCIYGGVTGVVIGIVSFPAQSTQISPAVMCTITLSVLYFTVCFMLWVARTMAGADSPCTNAALAMSTTVRKAPMFAVLFLASRMRALQLDPPHGMPPFWMQHCFWGITALIYLEAFLGAYVGSHGKKEKGYYGVYLFRCQNRVVHLAQHAFAIVTYVLVICVVSGVVSMESRTGQPAPLSTTMKCVLHFAATYFGVMLLQDVVMFAEEYGDIEFPILRDTVISAGISLSLAPLLCILFVATRMRALQITQQLGDPPGWAQDCMLVAVFATCVQSVCCLLMPIFIGSACKVDEDGNPDYDLQPLVGAYAVAIVKYVALMALHGSIIGICVAVYTMTPETAVSSGRVITDRKQLFKALAVTLLVFCIALLFSSAKVIGMAIKFVIESADQELIGVDITIEKVALNLFKGYVHVSKLKVHNPEKEMIYEKNAKGQLTGTPTGKLCDWKSAYIAKVDLILIKINVGRILQTCGKEFELQNLSFKGIHVQVEKPSTDLKAQNSNIEYIISHLKVIGLIAPPKEQEPEGSTVKTVETGDAMSIVTTKSAAANEADDKKKTGSNDPDSPTVIIHKIELGDIGAGVLVRGVKFLGEISFHPSIGVIEFDDVQEEIFNGREDLKPEEMVACIINAIVHHVFNMVAMEMPKHLRKAISGAASSAFGRCGEGLKMIPCGVGCGTSQ
jgi:hypothetical protein